MPANNTKKTPSYYDILGVPSNASSADIRKAYLKCSLKYHPDKNPDNIEEAQAKFVEIGRAYEILKDDTLRRQYDYEVLQQGGRTGTGFGGFGGPSSTSSTYKNTDGFSSGFGNGNGGGDNYDYSSSSTSGGFAAGGGGGVGGEDYETYRDFFDETVAGMSEADLAAAIGTAAMIGSLVGSLVGSHLAHNANAKHASRGAGAGAGAGGASSNILTTVGSLVGSEIASEMAAASVRQLHQSSQQRLEYKQKCRIARERGERLPDPPAPNAIDQVWNKTVQAVKSATQNPEQTAKSIGDLWNKARASFDAAAKLGGGTTTGNMPQR